MIPLNVVFAALMAAAHASVLEPAVSQVCVSSSGRREVTCTSEGHNVKFTWRLNNQSLHTDHNSPPADPAAEPPDRPVSSTVAVEADQSGYVTCEVGSWQTTVRLTDCRAVGFQFLYAPVVIAAAAVLFLLALSVCFVLLFKTRVSPDDDGDDGEITYADVKIRMRQKKREAETCVETVEYGQAMKA